MPGTVLRQFFAFVDVVLQRFFQGVSSDGKQGGLSDARSALLREMFRVFDELEDGLGAESAAHNL